MPHVVEVTSFNPLFLSPGAKLIKKKKKSTWKCPLVHLQNTQDGETQIAEI